MLNGEGRWAKTPWSKGSKEERGEGLRIDGFGVLKES